MPRCGRRCAGPHRRRRRPRRSSHTTSGQRRRPYKRSARLRTGSPSGSQNRQSSRPVRGPRAAFATPAVPRIVPTLSLRQPPPPRAHGQEPRTAGTSGCAGRGPRGSPPQCDHRGTGLSGQQPLVVVADPCAAGAPYRARHCRGRVSLGSCLSSSACRRVGRNSAGEMAPGQRGSWPLPSSESVPSGTCAGSSVLRLATRLVIVVSVKTATITPRDHSVGISGTEGSRQTSLPRSPGDERTRTVRGGPHQHGGRQRHRRGTRRPAPRSPWRASTTPGTP